MTAASGVGAAIRAARRAAGLTQEALGSAVGVSGSTVSLWESGSMLPPAARRQQLAQVLGIPAEALRPQRPEPPVARVQGGARPLDLVLAARGCASLGLDAAESAAALGVSVERAKLLLERAGAGGAP